MARNWKTKKEQGLGCVEVKVLLLKLPNGWLENIDLFEDWWVSNEPINQVLHDNTTVQSIISASRGWDRSRWTDKINPPILCRTKSTQFPSPLLLMSRIRFVGCQVGPGNLALAVVTSLFFLIITFFWTQQNSH